MSERVEEQAVRGHGAGAGGGSAGGGAGGGAAEAEAAIEGFRADYAAVKGQIARVIVGHEDVVDGVLTALFCNGHVLLEGVPGLGKTLLVRTLARALRLGFSRIQFTPDLMPADITGTTVIREGGGSREFVFERGPVFGQIVLADEINRATPKTQSALLEAMQERSVTVGGVTHRLPRPFLVMATQNPLEQEGTYPLPEAQLDRFLFKVLVGYSSRRELSEIVARTTGAAGASAEADVAPVLDEARITALQHLVHRCAITPGVQDYAVRLVLSTHPKGEGMKGAGAGGVGGAASVARANSGVNGYVAGQYSTPMTNKYVRVGASPRAAQALVLTGKCRALVSGRPSVAIEDIQWAAAAALRHRLILNFEATAEGVTADAIVENIVATLPRAAD